MAATLGARQQPAHRRIIRHPLALDSGHPTEAWSRERNLWRSGENSRSACGEPRGPIGRNRSWSAADLLEGNWLLDGAASWLCRIRRTPAWPSPVAGRSRSRAGATHHTGLHLGPAIPWERLSHAGTDCEGAPDYACPPELTRIEDARTAAAGRSVHPP